MIRQRGITFEHYDFPGTTRKGDIHEAGNTRVAWNRKRQVCEYPDGLVEFIQK